MPHVLSAVPSPAPPRHPGLDLLRALAIAMVVGYHSSLFGFTLPGGVHRFGWIGVDLFFVLSGYLIGGQILAQMQRPEGFRFGRFYARRALRILPAYLLVLAVYFLAPSWREEPVISPAWKFLLSVQNIHLQVGTAFSHAWSLAVEDQFYLLLPLLLVFLVRRPRWARALTWGILFAGLCLRAGLALVFRDPAGQLPDLQYFYWIYYPTWSRLDPLVLGVALATLEHHQLSSWRRLREAAPWLWIPALGAIAAGLWLDEGNLTPIVCALSFPLIAVGMATLLTCAESPRLPFCRIHVPGSAFLARIAYSVYLTHKLVVHAAAGWLKSHGIALNSVGAILMAYALTLLVGTALYLAVERPFLQLRNRIES
ncbi:MAG: acyltransferase [Verrucomicrobiota bacterium]